MKTKKCYQVTLVKYVRLKIKQLTTDVDGLKNLRNRIRVEGSVQTLRFTPNEIALLVKQSAKYGYQMQMLVEEHLGYLIADDVTTITKATPTDSTPTADDNLVQGYEVISPRVKQYNKNELSKRDKIAKEKDVGLIGCHSDIKLINGTYLIDCMYIPDSIAYEIVKKRTGKVFDYTSFTLDVATAYTNAVYTHMDGDNLRACDKLIINATVDDVLKNPSMYIQDNIITDERGATVEKVRNTGLSSIKILPSVAVKSGTLLPLDYINNWWAFTETLTRLIHPQVNSIHDMVAFIENDAEPFITVPTPNNDDIISCYQPYRIDTPTADGSWLIECKGIGLQKDKYKVQWRVQPPKPNITAFDLLHYPWYETIYSIIDSNGDYLL